MQFAHSYLKKECSGGRVWLLFPSVSLFALWNDHCWGCIANSNHWKIEPGPKNLGFFLFVFWLLSLLMYIIQLHPATMWARTFLKWKPKFSPNHRNPGGAVLRKTPLTWKVDEAHRFLMNKLVLTCFVYIILAYLDVKHFTNLIYFSTVCASYFLFARHSA